MENQLQLKWYQKPVTVVLFLILFFPVGIYLMWKHELWNKTSRVLVSVFFGFLVIANIDNKEKNTNTTLSVQKNDLCDDMDSYRQGLREGRLQAGILTDCITYYPYEGWAKDKDCYCKGFDKGKNE